MHAVITADLLINEMVRQKLIICLIDYRLDVHVQIITSSSPIQSDERETQKSSRYSILHLDARLDRANTFTDVV